MKQRNKDKNLEARQKAFDRLSPGEQQGRRRPGSNKKRGLT